MRFKFELINKTQVFFGLLKPSVKLLYVYIKFCRYFDVCVCDLSTIMRLKKLLAARYSFYKTGDLRIGTTFYPFELEL